MHTTVKMAKLKDIANMMGIPADNHVLTIIATA